MLQALFRLLGIDLSRKLAEVRGQIDELKRRAIYAKSPSRPKKSA